MLRSLVATTRCHLFRAPPLVLRWEQSVRCLSQIHDPKSKAKVPVVLREEDLEEQFVKGWGKGGQKINKVRNCVLLKHIPTGLHIRCQETRSLDGNRKIARRLLLQKLDDQINGELSKNNQKIEKLRKKKANRRNKSKQKYAAHKAEGTEEDGDSVDDSDDEGDSDFDDDDDHEEEEDGDDDNDQDASVQDAEHKGHGER